MFSTQGSDFIVPTGRASAATDRASNIDRSWFVRRSDRAHRVRPMVPGEFPRERLAGPPEWRAFVVVKQAAPGARLRVPFVASTSPCGCERCTAALWQRAASPKTRQAAPDIAAEMIRHGVRS
jgi:hypothetical protein